MLRFSPLTVLEFVTRGASGRELGSRLVSEARLRGRPGQPVRDRELAPRGRWRARVHGERGGLGDLGGAIAPGCRADVRGATGVVCSSTADEGQEQRSEAAGVGCRAGQDAKLVPGRPQEGRTQAGGSAARTFMKERRVATRRTPGPLDVGHSANMWPV
ncbi:hypothetical protein [Pseudenhygromyxa sp. WMMC2535]|uniref:hypothetical protein n=1 Tax=Pseudenhygromyxa sp. WMMC2535 TaxID=2712867 RepID=UPI0020D0A441|nr:hypothetical protein [Pseudenhygromyxa sp. WMMC2535]